MLSDLRETSVTYTISGDEQTGFVVEFSAQWGRVSTCPCCGKPIDARQKAEFIGKNLTLISEGPGKDNK